MKTLAELGSLKGQLALITGGGGHIGRTVAAGLAELGCDLCLLDLPESKPEEVAAELQARWSTRVVAQHVDLEIEAERLKVPTFVEEQFGRLDILINNAAFYPREKLEGWVAPLEEQSLEVVRRCIEVNLTAGFHLVQILSGLLRQARGRIINIGSIYGVLGPDYSLYGDTGMGNPAAYAMSKGGVVQFSRWLATTLAPDVRVNCLNLGGVYRNQPKDFVERYVARTPLRRMATEEDFKGAIAFLASDMSAYVTGQNIMVDGGWSSW